MSELKTYKMVDEKYCTDCVCVIPSEVYLKSEADKVIAEKDKVIAELEKKIKLYEDLGSCKKGCPALRHNQRRVESEIYRVKLKENEITEKDKELRHQKYKRCLAMAERCKDKIENVVQYNEHDDWLIINEYWERWQERWIKIAEKFKEKRNE